MSQHSEPTSRKKKVVAVLTGVALAGGVSSVAYAFWTEDGVGTGTASTGDTAAVTVQQAAFTGDIRPGAAAVTLSGTVTNPDENGPVKVGSVTITDLEVDPVGAGTCDETDYTLGGTAPINAVIANNSTASWSGLTIAFNNKATNQDACKGAALTISYAVSAAAS